MKLHKKIIEFNFDSATLLDLDKCIEKAWRSDGMATIHLGNFEELKPHFLEIRIQDGDKNYNSYCWDSAIGTALIKPK